MTHESTQCQLFNDFDQLSAAHDEYESSPSRSGPLAAPPAPAFAFESIADADLDNLGARRIMLDGRQGQAHIEYSIETVFYPYAPTPTGVSAKKDASYVSISGSVIAPTSRGSIHLASNMVVHPPKIELGYLSSIEDRRLAVYAFKNLRRIVQSGAFDSIVIGPNHGEVAPGVSVQTDEEIEE